MVVSFTIIHFQDAIVVLLFTPPQCMFTLLSILRRDALLFLPDAVVAAVEEAVDPAAIWEVEAVDPVSAVKKTGDYYKETANRLVPLTCQLSL